MKKQIAPWLLIMWGLVSLLPVVAMVLGVGLLCNGWMFNWSIVIIYFLLPLAMIGGSFLALLLPKSKKFQVIWFVAVVVLCLVLILQAMQFTVFEKLESSTGEQAAAQYETDESVFWPMPTLTELGAYRELEFHSHSWSTMVYFYTDADTLIVSYEPEAYALEKSRLEERFAFCDSPLTAHGYSCEPAFTLDGYAFRAVELEGHYPKCMVLVATNDATRQIVYLCYRDSEVDYIKSLPDYITDYCGWKYIR